MRTRISILQRRFVFLFGLLVAFAAGLALGYAVFANLLRQDQATKADERLVPAWVYQFAIDFCARNYDAIAPRLGGAAATIGRGEAVAWLSRNAPCYRVNYLDNARFGGRDRYVFILDAVDGRHWWVFNVEKDFVVDID